ncbi:MULTISPECIES: hypothetical protein [Bacillus subtilis group]|uniref:hypothetical protein n=1 Tax=Bacillus TaxID=1386 RepID=UPI0011A729D6|nr:MULTISPECIES: hypothetical protein [Bacillus subtilis group]MBT3123206.1 hypothetical protein [Bacillus inaquosorum]MCB5337336.1 hypothetical protein [Bacillus amyloliquefaciens]MCF7615377.1 hypothetical protein [Bacillus subtilis]QWK35304.1 hypothetical protein KM843_20575 [Bacillus velezensis]
MKRFEYGEITTAQRRIDEEFSFRGTIAYSLMKLLEDIGSKGWELVGEVKGKIIVKREVESE